MSRVRALAVLTVTVAVLGGVGVVGAQEPSQAQPEGEGAEPAVLLIMDSSLSMREPAGGGQSRIEAARAGVRAVVEALPDEAQVGMRVYGSEVNEASRAEGCRDTKLEVPVGPLDREQIVSTVDGLEPLGRTPIGRSLEEAVGDFPEGADPKRIVLVSDGGDNCAPPDPCEAAEEVAESGVVLTIDVVGLQVTDRVREQLECIADAGGGLYTDATDPEELTDELRALFTRAFRDYEPAGTPVQGGPEPGRATAITEGQYLDDIATNQQDWYTVRLEPGQRLWASALALFPDGVQGAGNVDVRVLDPSGEEVAQESRVVEDQDGSGRGANDSQSVRGEFVGGDDLPPGDYRVGVAFESTISPRGEVPGSARLPVELLVYVLEEGEQPQDIEPGRVLGPGEQPDGGADPTDAGPRGDPANEAGASEGDDEMILPAVGLGVVGLALGGVAGWTGVRRARSS